MKVGIDEGGDVASSTALTLPTSGWSRVVLDETGRAAGHGADLQAPGDLLLALAELVQALPSCLTSFPLVELGGQGSFIAVTLFDSWDRSFWHWTDVRSGCALCAPRSRSCSRAGRRGRGPVGIDPEVLLVDGDVDVLVHLGVVEH